MAAAPAAQRSFHGMMLALAGALVLAPDTLFMRWSGMEGAQMVAWRGLLFSAVMLGAWAVALRRPGDLGRLLTPLGLGAVAAQAINATLFATAVAISPVAVVLFALATVPIWSALLGAVFLGDRVGRATALTCAVVLAGIGLSVLGGSHGGGGGNALLGALCGLAVAWVLALSFTIYRVADLPISLTLGCGAGIAGLLGTLASDGFAAPVQDLLAIGVTGAIILPTSFFLLSLANRYTQSANVSLFMLLETVIGPFLVWAGTGERVGWPGIAGGLIVVLALAFYLRHRRRVA
ncbi:DMT family transporter [Oceaniglobus trochenteri]|uniref:DMT family transporter n=1 Tax=Oceaniglobus trochenteri TaxID=2763260 RepID=UPI001D0006CB